MKIKNFFNRPSDVYIALNTGNTERRDAQPFYSFDTDIPRVQPLWDKEEEFEVCERCIDEKLIEATREVYEARHEIEAEQFTENFSFPEPETLLLPAGRQPLYLPAPTILEEVTPENLEAQHIVYFSEIEFKDGTETIVEDKIIRENSRNFVSVKIVGALLMIAGLASILFPSITLNAAKVNHTVDPTNTTPGLSFSIASDDLTVTDNQGSMVIQAQTNQLMTSTLDLDVSTTGANGYKMYVTTSGVDKAGDYTNALVNKDIAGADGKGAKIQSLTASTQVAAFPTGYWGYTTTAAANIQNNTIFSPFPIYDINDGAKYGGSEIASANTAVADTDATGETPFTVGIKVGENLPAGDYTNELLFTVITNPVTVTYNLNFDGNTDDDTLMGVPTTVTVASADVFRDVTIPVDVPMRDKYTFIGWADTADATEAAYAPGDDVTMQVANINDTQVVNKTLYAVWEEIPDDTKLMQDFNDAIDLRTVGDTDTYKDNRDDKTYTVARLADGKVWMTQNIAYEAGASQMRDDFGGYYLRANANNVCPAGWHLPNTAEFVALDSAYGGSGSGKYSNAAIYNTYFTPPRNWVLGGMYRTTTTEYGQMGWDSVNVSALYMASDTNTVYANNIMAATLYGDTQEIWMDNTHLGKTYATPIRCVGDQPNVFYIQDFDDNTMLPHVGDSATLTDRRDNKTYTVARLSDGKVWTTQNLAYATGATTTPNTRGGYYSWSAAQTVCPAEWHLPTSNEYAEMYTKYPSVDAFTAGGPKLGFDGRYQPTVGSYQYVGSAGYYWDSTNEDEAFSFNNDGQIWLTYIYLSSSYSNQVRCVADKSAKVTFDANGGEGTMTAQSFTKGVKQNIAVNTFTRAGYEFSGWALTADAAVAKYVDEESVVFNKTTTLYAVWKPNYIQEFDAKTQIPNIGDTTTLIDKRDGASYTAKRLVDGKVWMTQNLRYTGGTDLGTSSTSSGSFTIDASNSEGSGTVSYVSSFSSTTSAKNVKYNGNVLNGAYYNWFAATEVCPAGWHLPSSAEHVAMDKAYGGTGQTRVDATMYSNYQLTTGNWPGMTLAGYYHDSTYESGLSLYWSNTAYGSTYASNDSAKFFYLAGSNTILPDYTYAKWFGRSVRCVANEVETISFDANGGTGTMADVTVEKGDSITLTNGFTRSGHDFIGWATSASATTAEYEDGATITVTEDLKLYAVWKSQAPYFQVANSCSSITKGTTGMLMDSRDEQIYPVYRFTDDNAPAGMEGDCIMAKDLSLGYVTGGSITRDSDLNLTTSDSAADANIIARTTNTNWSNTNYTPNRQYINGADSTYGAHSYYSYGAAQAVCPKGWRLPTDAEYNNLVTFMGGDDATSSAKIRSAPYNFVYGGYFNTSGWTDVGNVGFYWSSTENNSSFGYNLRFTASSLLVNYNGKNSGRSVRCVAIQEKATVTFDANGGTGTMASRTVVKGQDLTLPANAFTRDSYNFLGWATSASATTAEYGDEAAVTVTDNMTLYAVWKSQAPYFQTANSCASIPKGTTALLADSRDEQNYPVYRFADDNAPAGMEGDCIMAKDLSLGAASGGSTTKGNDLILSTSDSAAAGTIVAKANASSWTTTNSDSNLQYANGTDGTHSYYSYGAAQAVCPKGWKLPSRDEYNSIATFAGGNNSTGSALVRSAPYNFGYYGVFSNSGLNYLNSAGYYWSSTQNNSTNGYYLYLNASSLHANNSNIKNAGRSVRCVFIREKATITFDANGGSGTMANQTVEKGQSLTLPANTFTRNNHNFLGWATSTSASSAMYADKGTITVANNMTLYAVWGSTAPDCSDTVHPTATTGCKMADDRIWILGNDGNKATWNSMFDNATNANNHDATIKTGICPAGYSAPKITDYDNLLLAYGGTPYSNHRDGYREQNGSLYRLLGISTSNTYFLSSTERASSYAYSLRVDEGASYTGLSSSKIGNFYMLCYK